LLRAAQLHQIFGLAAGELQRDRPRVSNYGFNENMIPALLQSRNSIYCISLPCQDLPLAILSSYVCYKNIVEDFRAQA